MKATYLKRSPTTQARRTAVANAAAGAAAQLERLIKENIQSSAPRGRTYRRSSIKRRATKETAALGLRRRGKNAITGANFHRASAPGQPPAILSGRLINSIRSRQLARFKYRIGTAVVYAIYLDSPRGLNRPFFITVADNFRPTFFELIRRAFLFGN